jgi:hypothetical protein
MSESKGGAILECVICKEALDKEGEHVEALACMHTFHAGCIAQWRATGGGCPFRCDAGRNEDDGDETEEDVPYALDNVPGVLAFLGQRDARGEDLAEQRREMTDFRRGMDDFRRGMDDFRREMQQERHLMREEWHRHLGVERKAMERERRRAQELEREQLDALDIGRLRESDQFVFGMFSEDELRRQLHAMRGLLGDGASHARSRPRPPSRFMFQANRRAGRNMGRPRQEDEDPRQMSVWEREKRAERELERRSREDQQRKRAEMRARMDRGEPLSGDDEYGASGCNI